MLPPPAFVRSPRRLTDETSAPSGREHPFSNEVPLKDEAEVRSNEGGLRASLYGWATPLAIDFRRSYAESSEGASESAPNDAGTSEEVPTEEDEGAIRRAATNEGMAAGPRRRTGEGTEPSRREGSLTEGVDAVRVMRESVVDEAWTSWSGWG